MVEDGAVRSHRVEGSERRAELANTLVRVSYYIAQDVWTAKRPFPRECVGCLLDPVSIYFDHPSRNEGTELLDLLGLHFPTDNDSVKGSFCAFCE